MDAEKLAEIAVERTWQDVVLQVRAVLDYQLFELDGHGVSVAKLLTGIVLLFVGYAVSARAAREVDRRVLGRLNLDQSLRYTFRRLIFYLFFFIATMFTLRTLNVPITIFTVVGGALAVGIGFGSQNLVNNFISGILVMVERPIRVGDFIDVDGVSGEVISIGIRSTQVLTLANAVVIVPNTAFIEKYLTNWTLTPTVGLKVAVGVAYGTDLDLLKRVCFQALEGVAGILATPEPTFAFVDFGDNALLFEIFFEIGSENYASRRAIQSQVRFKLNDLFVKNQISIPFPQRDVHLVDVPASLLQSRTHV